MLLFSLSHFNYQYYSFKYISYYHVVVSPLFPPNCMYRNAYGQKLLYAEFMRAMFQEGEMRNAEALSLVTHLLSVWYLSCTYVQFAFDSLVDGHVIFTTQKPQVQLPCPLRTSKWRVAIHNEQCMLSLPKKTF
jgi:hypothetical protein